LIARPANEDSVKEGPCPPGQEGRDPKAGVLLKPRNPLKELNVCEGLQGTGINLRGRDQDSGAVLTRMLVAMTLEKKGGRHRSKGTYERKSGIVVGTSTKPRGYG